jgi:hypothetical protein
MSEIKTLPTRFDNNYLKQYCDENNIILQKNYSTTKVCRETIIEGYCKTEFCNNTFCKKFRQLTISGSFCKYCTELNRKDKVKISNLLNYGTENVFQSEHVKDKIKETNLERYGDTCALRNPLIKEKQQNTNLERYGDTCALRNPLIKDKQQNTNLERYGDTCALRNPLIKEKTKNTIFEKYGVEYTFQSEDVKDKIKETNLERYGDTCALRNPLIKEKQKNTCIEKYGVEYYLQTEDKKIKSIQTSLNKYGVEHPSQSTDVKDKVEQTCLEKYGTKCSLQNEEIKNKIRQTCFEKYGVEHPHQNAEISEKASINAYKSYDYMFPSGRIERIQGYEKFMLDDLLQKENILEEDIILKRSEVPECWYKDENGKDCRYYVDCFIKSQNRCIEAKSTWTAEKKEDYIYLKQQALKDAGYECEIWVYNGKGEKVECYK